MDFALTQRVSFSTEQLKCAHGGQPPRTRLLRPAHARATSRRISSKPFVSHKSKLHGSTVCSIAAAAESDTGAVVEPVADATVDPNAIHSELTEGSNVRKDFRNRPRGEGQRGGRGGGRSKEGKFPVTQVEVDKEYEGKVVAIHAYGGFVDIGCATDGLLHISQLSEAFVKSVEEFLSVGQTLTVRVIGVDLNNGKFALTLKTKEAEQRQAEQRQAGRSGEGEGSGSRPERGDRAPRGKIATRGKTRSPRGPARQVTVKEGEVVTGKVVKLASFGAFVDIGDGQQAMLPNGEIPLVEGRGSVAARDIYSEGQQLEATVIRVIDNKITLTQKSEEERAMESRMENTGMSAGINVTAKTTLEAALARVGLVRTEAEAEPTPEPAVTVVDDAAPEPVAEEKEPEPEPEPVAEQKQPEPEPEPVAEQKQPEPVAEQKEPEPEPEQPEAVPEAVAEVAQTQAEEVKPEPVVAAAPEPEPVAEEASPEPEAPVAKENAAASSTPEPVVAAAKEA